MRLFYLIFLLFGFQVLTGQIPDSLAQLPISDSAVELDSLNVKKKLFAKKRKGSIKNLFNFKKNYPSAKKAVLLSAILPGLGQIYNKKYWKLPIVYGGLGAMVYFIDFNSGEQKRFQTALEYRLDDDDGTVDEYTEVFPDGSTRELLDANSIRSLRNQHRKWKELSYIGLVFTYILSGVDTFVDAHLLRFDVNDDLTLKVNPDFQILPDRNASLGIGLGLKFNESKTVELPVELFVE